VTVAADVLHEVREISPQAEAMHEAGLDYVFLPGLKLPPGRQPSTADGLLCLNAREGYPSRLFLSAVLSDRGQNWRPYHILGRTWYSWSWNHVQANQRPAQILAQHLMALR
jgi:hypothetical protein